MADAVYTAEALSIGEGRSGNVRTTDGSLDLEMALPPGLGGTGQGLNPELLFAAGYAGCFHSALYFAARKTGADITGSSVGAQVSLVPNAERWVDLAVHLEVIIPNLPPEEAQQVVDLAHQLCPYSKATRGNIEVTIDVADD